MEKESPSGLSDSTNVPLYWIAVVAIAVLGAGMFIGALSGQVNAQERRISSMEAAISYIPVIDQRLARMEGAQGIKAPPEERLPASSHAP